MAKTIDERITEAKQKIEQEQNSMKRLMQVQKLQERKSRTKRLCSRMGLFESLIPDTIRLTDEQFKTFLEKALVTEHSRRILDGLTAQTAAATEPQTAGTAALTDTGESKSEGNGARVSG